MPLIMLRWQRLGVPLDIVHQIVDLDLAGYTIVHTLHALERWDTDGLEGIQYLAFNPSAVRESVIFTVPKPPGWRFYVLCML